MTSMFAAQQRQVSKSLGNVCAVLQTLRAELQIHLLSSALTSHFDQIILQ